MTLEPKTVEPGYLWRWTREACALWAANFPVWFALMLAPCLLAAYVGQSMTTGIPLVVLACLTVYVSLEFATTAEHGRVRLTQLVSLLGGAAQGVGDELWRHRKVLLLMVVISAAVAYALSLRPATPGEPAALPATLSVVDWLFSFRSPLLSAATMLFLGFQVLSYSGSLGCLAHPLCRMHGLSHEEACVLLKRASGKNVGPTLAIMLTVGGGPLLAIVAAPSLAPFLFCFFAAFCYVACRDMFGAGAPLHQPKEFHATHLANQGVPG